MRLILALGGALVLAGCAASKERVTLLSPAQDGKDIGALVVEHEDGVTVLDTANHHAKLRGARRPKVAVLEENNPFHSEVMDGLPTVAAQELFYFGLEEGTLRPAELDRLQRWLAENIPGRPGLHVEIAAHTDATGTQEINDRVSQERAANVLEQVLERIEAGEIDVSQDDIDVVAGSWHWARSGLAPGAQAEPDRAYRVVVVTVR